MKLGVFAGLSGSLRLRAKCDVRFNVFRRDAKTSEDAKKEFS